MKVIHDNDAAYEDILALSLLLLNADVVAVTVAYGESTPAIGAQNLARVCRMLKPGSRIPVAYGIDSALDAHGKRFPDYVTQDANTILDNTEVPQFSDLQVQSSAVKLIYESLMASEEKITIVATGSLVNIAELLALHPDCISKIDKLVIMGGAVRTPGNISDLIPDTENQVAEWNIYADPKAAQTVFSTPNLQISLVPIDITRQMPMTREFYARLKNETSPALKLARAMLTTLMQSMGETLFYGKLQFWDSLSAMLALDPGLASFEALPLVIDLETAQTKIAETADSDILPVQVATRIYRAENVYDTFIERMRQDVFNYKDRFFADTAKALTRPLSESITATL